MNDLLWFLVPVVLALTCVGVAALLDLCGTCHHKWGKWVWSEDSETYRQLRICEKCNFTEMIERKKLTGDSK